MTTERDIPAESYRFFLDKFLAPSDLDAPLGHKTCIVYDHKDHQYDILDELGIQLLDEPAYNTRRDMLLEGYDAFTVGPFHQIRIVRHLEKQIDSLQENYPAMGRC